MGLLDLPDLTLAFIAWAGGRPLHDCHDLVDFSKRLMPNCVRIAGWSHTFGGIMKSVANSLANWEEVIAQLRDLVSFFRNQTWRKHCVKCIGDRRANADKTLLSFNASFAKWRYETITVVLECLLHLRQICEEDLCLEWFTNPQDRAFINRVVVACKDKPLWRLLSATHRFIFKPLEQHRRWGMVCGCPEHIQQRREHRKVSCSKDGRRLGEAWPKVTDMITDFRNKKRTLVMADVEGDGHLLPKVSRLLTKSSAYINTRLKYLGVLPWYLVHCGTEAGAREAVRQFDSVPPAEHDPFSQEFFPGLAKMFATSPAEVLLAMPWPRKSVAWSTSVWTRVLARVAIAAHLTKRSVLRRRPKPISNRVLE